MSLDDLAAAGFDIHAVNHARAVLTKDFPGPLNELCGVLLGLRLTDVEMIRGGGVKQDRPSVSVARYLRTRRETKASIAVDRHGQFVRL